MAYVTGTASGSIDFWDKLVSFLTTNTTLVGAGQNWTVVWTKDSGRKIVLRANGGGSNFVYVGLVRTDTTDTDNKSITIYGMSGFNSTATEMSGHVNVSPGTRMWLDAGSMKYWFVASARRFTFVANISIVYEIGHAGFFLPYALPTVYPYPMIVGATSSLSADVTSWRSLSNYHAAFTAAPYNAVSGAAGNRSNAYILGPDAVWRNAAADDASPVTIGPVAYNVEDQNGDNNFHLSETASSSENTTGYLPIRQRIMRGYGDIYALEQITLIETASGVQHHGVLDGLFHCSGISNASENIISISSVDHLVVQNVNRTTATDYIAIRLE